MQSFTADVDDFHGWTMISFNGWIGLDGQREFGSVVPAGCFLFFSRSLWFFHLWVAHLGLCVLLLVVVLCAAPPAAPAHGRPLPAAAPPPGDRGAVGRGAGLVMCLPGRSLLGGREEWRCVMVHVVDGIRCMGRRGRKIESQEGNRKETATFASSSLMGRFRITWCG